MPKEFGDIQTEEMSEKDKLDRQYAPILSDLKSIREKHPELKDKLLKFKIGDMFIIQDERYDNREVIWEVAHAEYGHYLLERRNEEGTIDFQIISEEKLEQINKGQIDKNKLIDDMLEKV